MSDTKMTEVLARFAEAIEYQNQLTARTVALLEEDSRRRGQKRHAKIAKQALRKAESERAVEEKPLRRLNMIGWINSIPGLAQRFEKEVPESYLTTSPTGGMTVKCPCGEEPPLTIGMVVECACGRWYCRESDAVRVYRPSDGVLEGDDQRLQEDGSPE